MGGDAGGRLDAITGLPAQTLRDRLAEGSLRAAEVAAAANRRIAVTEPEIRAWAWHEPEHVASQAAALDRYRATGRSVGPLHGVTIGLKDIIDTARVPTENGTPIDAGRVPEQDAWIVARLKSAGALIVGKTHTTELAFTRPAPTGNPVAPGHTPGGSSSGSAAAVAAGHASLAIGTQTGGSVVRPAAFCGVVGYKPSFGAIPRTGVLTQSPSLDTVGVFARCVADAAMLCDVLFGHDPLDTATRPAPPPRILAATLDRPPVPPVFAFVRPPGWNTAEEATRAALGELVAALGEQCFEAPLPNAFDEAAAIRERINLAEMAKCYFTYERRGRDALSESMLEAIDAGKQILARDYIAALDWPDVLYAGLAQIFERCDAIIAPASLGPAPKGLSSTGSPIFNGLWTLVGTPAITLPVFKTDDGLPMGVQVVGRRGDDARLLRTARWLMDRVTGGAPAQERGT